MKENRFSFGKRRIRAMNYTRQVSLPLVWLKNAGLDLGGSVELELCEDGALLLRPVDESKEADTDE
jgi:antitoxin component of MazEF toxin-antitoxin module